MSTRKKAPPKKPETEVVASDVPLPVPVPTPAKRRRRGSPKGHLNLWERLYAGGKAIGAVVITLVTLLAEQIKDSLPLIQQTAPIWIAILIGGVAGTVIYYHEAGTLKRTDNTGDAGSDAAGNNSNTGTGAT